MKQMQAEGNIVQCIGAVIDVEFYRAPLSKIYDALFLEGSDLVLEVKQQLGDGVVRAICLGSAEGLRRGPKGNNMGAPIQVPGGATTLGRIKVVLGRPIDEAGAIDAAQQRSIHQPAPKFDELSP